MQVLESTVVYQSVVFTRDAGTSKSTKATKNHYLINPLNGKKLHHKSKKNSFKAKKYVLLNCKNIQEHCVQWFRVVYREMSSGIP